MELPSFTSALEKIAPVQRSQAMAGHESSVTEVPVEEVASAVRVPTVQSLNVFAFTTITSYHVAKARPVGTTDPPSFTRSPVVRPCEASVTTAGVAEVTVTLAA